MEDDDENFLNYYLNRNSQVRGCNVRDFVRTHGSPPSNSEFVQRYDTHLVERQSEYERNLAISERIGNVEIGVSDINKVSTIVTHEGIHADRCAICQSTLVVGKRYRRLNCLHTYCISCIEKWMAKKRTCPVCMFVYDDKKIENIN